MRRICLMICLLFVIQIPAIFAEEAIEFTLEEVRYIEENGFVEVGIDPEFVPYEFVDIDGDYKGYTADILELIEQKTGLKFNIHTELSWSRAIEMANQGQLDLLPAIEMNEKRQEMFIGTDQYLAFKRVILSRDDHEVVTFDNLDDYVIGVQENTSHHHYIMNETDIEPLTYEGLEATLKALSNGEVDAVVANHASSKYLIKQLGMTNVKIDDTFTEDTGLSMAVSNKNVVLLSILNKGLESITEAEIIEIQNRWLGIEQAPDYSGIIKSIIIGVLIVLLVLAFILYWAYTLRREIERRKVVEAKLVEAKKEAEVANMAKSTFVAHMSHEIRTPLNAITGIAYLLENTKTTSMQKNYINNLKDASYNLLNIVNDILDFSKIEAGEVTIENIPFSLDHLLDRVGKLMMPKANSKGLDLHVKKAVDVTDKLVGDPTRLEQILINLINNAIKFTHEGQVTIEVSTVAVYDDRCILKFTVTDTGIGIEEEQMNHMFIPFHQLDSSVTRKYGGTGLGLSITKNIITKLKGTIDVISKSGEGSVFYFVLPFEYQNKAIKKSVKRYPDFSKVKALVIDEDQVDCQIIVDYLKSFDLETTCANTYQEGLDAMDDSIQLLVVDVHVGGGDGLSLAEIALNREIKVILTAKQIVENEYEMAEEIGVSHTLMKPVISSILYDSIVQCFVGNKEEQLDEVDEVISDSKPVNHSKILLAEDNEVNQMIEKEILRQQGYEVVTVENGQLAVEAVKQEDFSVVLMDIHMPIMDGYEATKKIKLIKPDLPVIAMTAISFERIKEECETVGMSGFVSKPFDPDQLFSTIQEFTAKERVDYHGSETLSLVDRIAMCDQFHYLDVKQGLKRIGNNEKLFVEVLEKYYDDTNGKGNLINRLIQNKDFEAAHKLIHKIKGSSGNVGAIRLFQSANILNEAVDSKVEVGIGPYLWEFERDLKNTLKVIDCVLEEVSEVITSSDDGPKSYSEEVEQLSDKLLSLLEVSDLDAFKVLEEIKAKVGESDRYWMKVEAHMKHYNFKLAAVELNKPDR